jgi:ABC-type phosphate transport system substrate-binding protein
VLASDEAVIRFVSSTPGAIGYVSNCLADRRVKVIAHLDTGSVCPR